MGLPGPCTAPTDRPPAEPQLLLASVSRENILPRAALAIGLAATHRGPPPVPTPPGAPRRGGVPAPPRLPARRTAPDGACRARSRELLAGSERQGFTVAVTPCGCVVRFLHQPAVWCHYGKGWDGGLPMSDAVGVSVERFATHEADVGWQFLERVYTLQPVKLFGDQASLAIGWRLARGRRARSATSSCCTAWGSSHTANRSPT